MMVRAWRHRIKNYVKKIVNVVSGDTTNKTMVVVGLQPVPKKPDDGIFFVEGEIDKRLVTLVPAKKRLFVQGCLIRYVVFHIHHLNCVSG